MRDYTKAIEAVQQATEHDTERKHTSEISAQEIKCQQALFSQRGNESQEETLERAMRDPEVAVSCCDICSPHIPDSSLLLGHYE
jgi:stress-induced-phosphoprotein 1